MYLKVVTWGKEPALCLVWQRVKQEYKLPRAPAMSLSVAMIFIKVTFSVQSFDLWAQSSALLPLVTAWVFGVVTFHDCSELHLYH